jgi:hypothetical protein
MPRSTIRRTRRGALQVGLKAAGESACRPGSVHPLARADGHPSRTVVADSLLRSTREHRAGYPQSLAQDHAVAGMVPLDLAPGGVYRAAQVTLSAGGLLHRRFTLTPGTSPEAVCFLWHYPAGRPGSALPTTLPCGARTFLGTPGQPGATRPPGQLARRSAQDTGNSERAALDSCLRRPPCHCEQ